MICFKLVPDSTLPFCKPIVVDCHRTRREGLTVILPLGGLRDYAFRLLSERGSPGRNAALGALKRISSVFDHRIVSAVVVLLGHGAGLLDVSRQSVWRRLSLLPELCAWHPL